MLCEVSELDFDPRLSTAEMSASVKRDLTKAIINDNLSDFEFLSKSLESLKDVINLKSNENSLHLCSIFNSTAIMKYLLTECAQTIDVNLTNREGKTALHLSAQHRHIRCCELLLSNQQTVVDALNRSDWSPLMLALTKTNNLEIVKLLVDNGANLHLKNKDGWNGFHIAVRTGYLPQIKYLLSKDFSVCQTRSKTNRSPLHTAALCGDLPIVEFLLNNCNYESDQRDSCGVTPIMESFRSNNPDISRLLIAKHNANFSSTDILGRNGLHISCEANAIESIKYLLNELNFNINCVTTIGSLTALHLAVKEGHIEALNLLLHYGSDIKLRDDKQRTAFDLAVALNRDECASLLAQRNQVWSLEVGFLFQ